MATVDEILEIAQEFLIFSRGGPSGRMGSFDPVSAKYEETEEVWIVVAKFSKGDEIRTAKIEIDDESGEVLGFEVT